MVVVWWDGDWRLGWWCVVGWRLEIRVVVVCGGMVTGD